MTSSLFLSLETENILPKTGFPRTHIQHTHPYGVRIVSKFTNKWHVIHKCKHCYIYVQTNECAFPTLSPFVTIPAFICGFLTLSLDTLAQWLDSQMDFFLCSLSDVSYNFSQSHECKFERMIECDHIALHVGSYNRPGEQL